MTRVIDRYEIFQPKKLLFTRLDETDRYGALVSEAARRSLPISFLATGQQIPDDLEPATKESIADDGARGARRIRSYARSNRMKQATKEQTTRKNK